MYCIVYRGRTGNDKSYILIVRDDPQTDLYMADKTNQLFFKIKTII